jgi:ADP-heptose:LPS heptosyltransferase
MNRLKDLIYSFITLLAKQGGRRRNDGDKRTLILRVDEIGDYMLWRPFLAEMAAHVRQQQGTIHFCGNRSWKNLFDTLDQEQVDETCWLDKIRFKKDMVYRYRFLRSVYRQGYTTVINPGFSRDKRYDDAITAAAKAPATWGMVANTEAMRAYEYGYDKALYTHLFDHTEKPVFEFYRNRLFSEFVTGRTSEVNNTRIDTGILPPAKQQLPENYFIVFPGSRSAARIWPAENFAAVSRYLNSRYGATPIVCGAGSDKEYAAQFILQYGSTAIDLTGSTTLTDMLHLLKHARCLLSVDTGSIHLAAAVGCTVFGIFNGSQYGRFAPYPTEIANNIHAIYPDAIENDLKDIQTVRENYEFVIAQPYASVTADKVIGVIEKSADV